MVSTKWITLLAVVCLLTGCAKSPSTSEASSPSEAPADSSMSLIDAEGSWEEIQPGSVYTGEITVHTPEASGTVTFEGNGVTIDASHTEDGYIMVKCENTSARLKVRVILGEQKYTYDLNQNGEYETFPLQMGNGTYEIKVFQQLEGTSYSQLYFAELDVNMPDTDRVFVFPSQYIWYTNEENAVKLSYDLCADLTEDSEKAECIYNYIVNLLSYDYEEAETVQSGYIPDLDEVLATKKGICFDYSALYAAMLRAQDIPVRLVIGYVQPENVYHAWNQVLIDGSWVWKDSTFGPNSSHQEKDYIQEREY